MSLAEKISRSYWNRDGRTPSQIFRCLRADGDLTPAEEAEGERLFGAEIAAEVAAAMAPASNPAHKEDPVDLLAKYGASERALLSARIREAGNNPVMPAKVVRLAEEGGKLVAYLAEGWTAPRRWVFDGSRFELAQGNWAEPQAGGAGYSKID